MKKVTVLRLSGCKYCGLLIERLHDKGIKYTSIDANVHNTLADEVEDLIETTEYPIVILHSNKSKPTYLFRALDMSDIGVKDIGVATKVGFTSVKAMVEYILNT